MERITNQTKNIADANFAALSKMFPNAVTETINVDGKLVRAIDKDILMQEISTCVVEGTDERYQFTWPDKRKAILAANAPVSTTLRPVVEDSMGKDGTPGKFDSENLYIEGDNLDVLKLLQETYLGKIKMIYIDPPYNTGNDFVYKDDFAENSIDYLARSGQFDDQGNQLEQNTDSNGRFHTDWLNMLYPRIKLARNLLSENGVIFISIDEHEIDNCTKICDEIFGRINRIGIIVIKSNPRGSMSTGSIANLHEYLVIYARNCNQACIVGQLLNDDMLSEYKYHDEKGAYRLLGLRMRGGFWRRSDRPNLYFPLYVSPKDGTVSISEDNNHIEQVLPVQPSTGEDGTWRWSADKVASFNNELIGRPVSRDGSLVWDVYQKDYLAKDGVRRTKVKSIWDANEINYQTGTIEIKNLFTISGVFDYSKPVFLISQIMGILDIKPNDIVLDFFSGSGTTAHSVMEYCAEGNDKCRFIMVQLPEKTAKSTEAYKAGYFTICDIGKERIRRASKKIRNNKKANLPADFDGGFRCLRLDSSNMQDVNFTPVSMTQDLLSFTTDNIKIDRTPEDLLFQAMLQLGIDLGSKIDKKSFDRKTVFSVADGFLLACFDTHVTNDTVTAIAKEKPYYAVFRDSCIADDSTATNFDQIFETYSKSTVRRVL